MTAAEALAERAAVQRVLNAYLREYGGELAVLDGPGPEDHPSAAGVTLPRTGATLAAAVDHRSPGGHHRYGSRWWARHGAGWRPVTAMAALELVIDEVAAADPDAERRGARRAALLAQVADSVARTARYVGAELAGRAHVPVVGRPDAFLAAEQGLRTGHPFHPTPKCVEGFAAEDTERYAPELGAEFPLHWTAVAPEVAATVTIPGAGRLHALEAVRGAAARRLPAGRAGWPLVPLHPWQSGHLHGRPEMRDLVDGGLALPLGPLGPPVRPTSSVRTVWDPRSACFLKLALSVRVTNFVRVNQPEQLARAVHAASVLGRVLPGLPLPGLTVLLELGYRGVRAAPDRAPEPAGGLLASTAVVVREGPDLGRGVPMVVAALLEPSAVTGEPPLAAALASAARGAGLDGRTAARRWVRRYAGVSLVPLVRLLATAGVGLEAHTQNSLVTLEGGWPVHLHVRDLEGATVDRGHPLAADGYGGALPAGSPARYDADEVWRRFAYYVVVNHLGEVVATVARCSGAGEGELWAEVAAALGDQAPCLPTQGRRRVEDLLAARHLPAKANLASRFRERGEDPLYVPVPNPLRP